MQVCSRALVVVNTRCQFTLHSLERHGGVRASEFTVSNGQITMRG